jgi:hypothetical protein
MSARTHPDGMKLRVIGDRCEFRALVALPAVADGVARTDGKSPFPARSANYRTIVRKIQKSRLNIS